MRFLISKKYRGMIQEINIYLIGITGEKEKRTWREKIINERIEDKFFRSKERY